MRYIYHGHGHGQLRQRCGVHELLAHPKKFKQNLFLLLLGDRASSGSFLFSISHITRTSSYSQLLTSCRSLNKPLLRIPRRKATPFQTLLIGNPILSHNFIYSSSSSQRRERKRIDSKKKIQNLGGQLTAKNQHLLIKQHQSHTKQTNIFVFPKSKQHQQKLVETFLIGKVLKLIEQLTLSTLPPFSLSFRLSLPCRGKRGHHVLK